MQETKAIGRGILALLLDGSKNIQPSEELAGGPARLWSVVVENRCGQRFLGRFAQ